MADFTQKTNVKSAIRKLADPIADVAAFNTIVQSVITTNPLGCISYMMGGENHQPVEKSREAYTAKFVYQDAEANRIGSGSESYNTLAGFNDGIAAVIANTREHNSARRNRLPHDSRWGLLLGDLKCHDPIGETYFVTISRKQGALFSYESEAIRARVETWADGVTALA